MRISFIEPHLLVFGGIRRILELSNRLIDLGETVTIYHPEGTPCQWMTCKAKVKRLSCVLQDEHDVIVFNDPPHYKYAKRSRAGLKVFYILGLYEKDRLERFSLKILWPKKGRVISIKRSLQLPFVKITNAAWMQRYLRDQLNVESELVTGGINREVFYPVVAKWDENAFRILCTGDPREYKGTQTVIDAVEIVKNKFNHLSLETYYGKNIPQELMAEKYSSADIFVDAQWDSGCGWNNPVAEAMACKVPVVCTEIGGVEDFAFHGKTALLTPEKNPNETAKAIIRLLEDDSLRRRLKENAYRHIVQFDWNMSALKLRSVFYRELGMDMPQAAIRSN